MKRFTYAMVMAVALVVMVSSFAIAGDQCKSKTAAKSSCSAAEKAACASSAKASCTTAEKVACATSAKTACATSEKASCTETDKAAYKAAFADMHKCCGEAL